jgi:hypothetical protein
MRGLRVVAVGALCASSWAAPCQAHEGELTLAGAAGAFGVYERGVGPALGVSLGRGLSDRVVLRLEALGGIWQPERTRSDLVVLDLGLQYRWDITHWVPFVGAAVGAVHSFEGADTGAWLQPLAGLDYLLSRSYSLGARYGVAFTPGSSLGGPVHLLTLHFERHFGW